MSSTRRAFVIMPFGKKKAADGAVIDFDAVYKEFLAPAITAAGLVPHRADADRRSGSIHLDMFQDLLLAEFVVADLTIDNPNVWYEIGVRHALRAGGAVLTYGLRDRLPFDIAGQRMLRYTLKDAKLDPSRLESERKALTEAKFEPTRGKFRFNKNNFPIQDYYLREVYQDAGGHITNKTIAKVFSDFQDVHAAKCKMK